VLVFFGREGGGGVEGRGEERRGEGRGGYGGKLLERGLLTWGGGDLVAG